MDRGVAAQAEVEARSRGFQISMLRLESVAELQPPEPIDPFKVSPP